MLDVLVPHVCPLIVSGLLSIRGPAAVCVIKVQTVTMMTVEEEEEQQCHFGASALPVTMTGFFFCSR